MYIKKLTLHNFQKHSELEIKFNKGVNVLEGETGSGKSCIVRAIQWLCYNEGRTKDLRKENTKKTKVLCVLDNAISITRFVSNSTNGYIIKKDGEEKRYDSIGRGVPEEVQKVIRMVPLEVNNENLILNIDKQIDMPFLIGRSDGFKAKLFNKLTGSEIIDYVLKSTNSDKLESKRKIKDIEERLEEYDEKEEDLKNRKKELKKLLEKIQKTLKKEKTKSELERFVDTVEKTNNINNKLKKLKELSISGLKKLQEKYKKYLKLKDNIDSQKDINDKLQTSISTLADKIPNLEEIAKNIQQFVKLQKIDRKIKKVDLTSLDKKLENYKKKYKKKLKDKGICPVCNQNIGDIDICI